MTNFLSYWKETLAQKESITLSVRVRPQAVRTCIKGILSDGSVKIDVAAVPEDNAANEELMRFFSQEFEVPQSSVEIVKGKTARMKVVRIHTAHAL